MLFSRGSFLLLIMIGGILTTVVLFNEFSDNLRLNGLIKTTFSNKDTITTLFLSEELYETLLVRSSSDEKESITRCAALLVMARNGNLNGIVNEISEEQVSSSCLLRTAKELEELGDMVTAKHIYEKVLELENLREAHRSLADIYYREGEYRNAVQHFEEVVESGGQISVNDYFRLSQAYRNTGQMENSFNLVLFARSIYPRDPWLAQEYTKHLVYQGSEQEAIQFLGDLIRENPEEPRLHYVLCRTFSDLGQKKKALSACERAISIDPAFTHSYLSASELSLETGSDSNALNYALEVVTREKGSGSSIEINAYINLGDIYFHLGDYSKGTNAYCQALTLRISPEKRQFIRDRLLSKNISCD